ncbi:hypothetical protein AVEN_185794-1 [Araneus ventricosus]|uniref:Retrovirus-related Pol polyprotein from transposon TNT 1-94-like beta-barrel domain-containing protein n=1 Tax=Araneus ventricosus TaxID=182803 RepID=A0A4Y2HIL3_ARAVE|nr:hypothetical protein AVEN_185794-1 [Araneus ventricosus]
MTSEKWRYQNLRSYTSMVEVINSENVEVSGVGNIVLSLHVDDEFPRNITLSNVLYVPKLGRNLFSIGRIEEKGLKVEFLNGEAKLIGKNGETFLTAKRKGRLYIINENKSSVYFTKTENKELWHRRMGNPHYNAV